MRVEKVYGRYFVLWDDAVSGQKKVVSLATMSTNSQWGMGAKSQIHCPLGSTRPARNALPTWAPYHQDQQTDQKGDLSAHGRGMELYDL